MYESFDTSKVCLLDEVNNKTEGGVKEPDINYITTIFLKQFQVPLRVFIWFAFP